MAEPELKSTSAGTLLLPTKLAKQEDLSQNHPMPHVVDNRAKCASCCIFEEEIVMCILDPGLESEEPSSSSNLGN